MNTKAKGNRNEYKSRDLLISLGYRVTRAAGSMGEWDLVGISSVDIVLIQCKSNRKPPAHEIEAMKLFPSPSNARKLIHIWHDRQKMPEVIEL